MKEFRHVKTKENGEMLFSYGHEYLAMGRRDNKVCVWNHRDSSAIIDRNTYAAFSAYVRRMLIAADKAGYDVNIVPVHSVTIDENNIVRVVTYFDKARLQ